MAIKDVVLGYAKGDKGDRGPQGEKGATGAIGPKGDPGNIADAQITDTEGLDVAKGQKTTAQKLFDAIANRIVTKLVTNDALTKKLADYMLKGMMSNTNVNNTGTVPTSALMYSMFEQINNNTDILENRINNTKRADNIEVFADGCEVGLTSFICHSETIGLPSSSYTSGTGLVLKRKQENVMVLLFATNTTTALKCKNEGGWRDWKEYTTKSDLKVIKKANVQFSNGFAEISFPGITYDSAVCINQEYRSSDGVQNLVFTAQVSPNELIIYARNAGDGSRYNGILNIMVIAIG